MQKRVFQTLITVFFPVWAVRYLRFKQETSLEAQADARTILWKSFTWFSISAFVTPAIVFALLGWFSTGLGWFMYWLLGYASLTAAMNQWSTTKIALPDWGKLLTSSKQVSWLMTPEPTEPGMFWLAHGFPKDTKVPRGKQVSSTDVLINRGWEPWFWDYAREEKHPCVLGELNLGRQAIVSRFILGAFYEPNTVCVCLDAGRGGIQFTHLRYNPEELEKAERDPLTVGPLTGCVVVESDSQIEDIIRWAKRVLIQRRRAAYDPNYKPTPRLLIVLDEILTKFVIKMYGGNAANQSPLQDLNPEDKDLKWMTQTISAFLHELIHDGKHHGICVVSIAEPHIQTIDISPQMRQYFEMLSVHSKQVRIFDQGIKTTDALVPEHKYVLGRSIGDSQRLLKVPVISDKELAQVIHYRMKDADESTLELWHNALDALEFGVARPVRKEREIKIGNGVVVE